MVRVQPLGLSTQTLFDLEDNLLLFFTGFSRAAGDISRDQQDRSKARQGEMLDNLHYVKALAYRSKEALESGALVRFGELLHEHWEHKKRRSRNISNPQIDAWYELAMRNGAIGGKLVGAGGGGFLMFYASDRNRLRQAMAGAVWRRCAALTTKAPRSFRHDRLTGAILAGGLASRLRPITARTLGAAAFADGPHFHQRDLLRSQGKGWCLRRAPVSRYWAVGNGSRVGYVELLRR
jgi:hypothetical protein